jgi:hypothetical protein
MKTIPCLLAACLLAGCVSGPLVQTDHDPGAVFAAYGDYAWRQQPPISNPLLKQRVVQAIDAELAGKGWRLVPEQEADVVLVANVSARDEQSIDAFYDGADWNGWEWRRAVNPGGAPQRVEVHTFKVGTLVLDMFDAATKRAVWRATASGTVSDSPEKNDAAINAALDKMFAAFPPGSAAQ